MRCGKYIIVLVLHMCHPWLTWECQHVGVCDALSVQIYIFRYCVQIWYGLICSVKISLWGRKFSKLFWSTSLFNDKKWQNHPFIVLILMSNRIHYWQKVWYLWLATINQLHHLCKLSLGAPEERRHLEENLFSEKL